MIDKAERFWCFGGVKFLPTLRPLAVLATALALNACSTAANRRELYNTTEANGAWHDYEARREAEAEVGLPPGGSLVTPTTAPTAAPRGGPGPAAPRGAQPAAADPVCCLRA